MAVVYRAYQQTIERHVALKVIKLDNYLGDDEEFQKRFEQEAELIAALEHIHILPIYDYGITEGELAYIVMRLMRGGTLADFIRQGPLPLERAADILMQVARGLSHAHKYGVIHRDLKPSNILFDTHGNAYLSDFGLAKSLSVPDLTKPGNVVGTPAYVAPEALRGEPIDRRADVYSLGILAYEMLTGRLPFEATDNNIMALMRKHLEEEPPRMRQFNQAIAPEVEAAVMKALRKDPAQRFAEAEDFANAINIALGRQYSTGSSPAIHLSSGLLPVAVKRHSRILSVAALVLLLALGAWLAMRAAPTPVSGDVPVGTFVSGETGEPADAAPAPGEVETAKAKLGSEGFIAFVPCTMESEFQVTRAREMGDFAAAYGLGYRVYDSESDPYRQITQIERARLDGAKAIILCPLDSELLEPALTSLANAGIPIVFITLYTPGYGVMLDSDNYNIGLEIGRETGRLIRDERGGQADVVLLGYPGFPASERRIAGIREGLLGFAPDANIIGVERGFTREFSYESIKQLLDEDVQFDVIASINDAGSLGAIDALVEAGIAPDEVIITSANAESLAIQYVRDGYFLRATLHLNRELGSRVLIDATTRLLAGATLPETFLIPPGELVTADSLADAEG